MVVELRAERPGALEENALHLADGAFVEQGFDLDVLRISALMAHHRVELPAARRRFIHCLRILGRRAGRLVAQHILARFEGADYHGRVLLVRRHNDDRVKTLPLGIHLLFGTKYRNACGQMRGCPLRIRVTAASHCSESQAADLSPVDHHRILLAHCADSDDGAADRIRLNSI